jgi:hypothetical protein
MNRQRVFTIIFFLLLIISGAILSNILSNFYSLFDNIELLKENYAKLLSKSGIYSICMFIVLLSLGIILYYLTSNKNYIIITNIFYATFILIVFISFNKKYFIVQNIDYMQQGEYWLTMFMGIFYIIGSVLVSAISYITLRNYTKRNNRILNNNEQKD